jgi:PAS domain S-box-containing protein
MNTQVDQTFNQSSDNKLKESETLISSLLNAIPQPTFVIDSQGILLYINNSMAQRFNKSIQELLGTNAFDLLPAEIAEKRRSLIFSAIEKKQKITFEDSRNGQTFINYIYPVGDNDGKITRAVVVALDITERKEAEIEISLGVYQLKANLENTPNVAIQWFDQNGKIIYWNPVSEQLYGWKAEEAVGKTLEDLIYTKEQEIDFKKIINDIQTTGKPYGPYETYYKNRLGKTGWLLSTTFSIPTDKDSLWFVCMDVDITERKLSEKKLKEKIDELEQFNKAAVDRELKMIELKNRIVELETILQKNNIPSQ